MFNNFYIYFHINPIKNEIFYCGKGSGKRCFDKSGRNLEWKELVNNYGFIINIIEENLTEKEAFNREKFYIKKIGRKDQGLGTLINLTDGGDGISGHKRSDATKKKMSESKKGKKMNLTNEARKIMSDAKKGNKNRLNKKHSIETKQKLSDASKGNKNSVGHKHSDETKYKLSEISKNMSDETKKKISDGIKGNKNALGHKVSDKAKKKVSNAQRGNKNRLGKKHSDETKKKISETIKRKYLLINQ